MCFGWTAPKDSQRSIRFALMQTASLVLAITSVLGCVWAQGDPTSPMPFVRPIGASASGTQKPADSLMATSSSIQLIPSGFQIKEPGVASQVGEATRWNRTLLLSKPRIESGATDMIPVGVQQVVSKIHLLIAATCKETESPPTATGSNPKPARFSIVEVGVGYCVAIEGGYRVISTSAPDPAKSTLGFYGRQVLSENEKQLSKLRIVGACPEMILFDAPAVVLRNSIHQDSIMRHAVVVHPMTGHTETYVWQLEKSKAGGMRLVDPSIRVVQEGAVEDRKIHVDRSEFFLGIPNERSFALTELPPGKSLSISAQLENVAVAEKYRPDTIQSLLSQLRSLSEASRTLPRR